MKGIAVLTNNPDREDLSEKLAGIEERSRDFAEPVTIHIFRSRVFRGMAPGQVTGEYSIFTLPDPEAYEAFILDLHHVSIEQKDYLESSACQELIRRILATKKPVLSIGDRIRGTLSLRPDEDGIMDILIEHLVSLQKCRSFWLIGGTAEAAGVPERMDFCVRSIREKLGGEARIETFCETEEADPVECGIRGFQRLYGEQLALPDIVLASDDRVALGVMNAAEQKGFCAPEDFLLTGFGNRREGRCCLPALTTVDLRQRHFGHCCMDLLALMWSNKSVQPEKTRIAARLILRDSCGCPSPLARSEEARRLQNDNVFYQLDQDRFTRHIECLENDLLSCDTINQIGLCFQKSLRFLDCRSFYLVLGKEFSSWRADDAFLNLKGSSISGANSRFPVNGFPKEMKAVFRYEDGQLVTKDAPVSSLLAAFREETMSEDYLFMPIHFREYTVGYFAARDTIRLLHNPYLARTMSALNVAIENLYTRRILSKYNHLLSDISTRDAMTGFYNRLGYQRLACRRFEENRRNGKSLTILFLDMDGLKRMNDTYGHECGDYALCAITEAIGRHCGADTLKIRMGGDEFLVMSERLADEQVEKLLSDIEREIPFTEQVRQLPYPPGISVGYIHTDPASDRSLDEYVREADEFMYNEKKRKGVART